MNKKIKEKSGTFALNKKEPIHNWYSYVEGYSSCLVKNEIELLKNENIKSIYDPFGGTGTTPLVAVQNGFDAYYSESNPFMLKVINTKINSVKNLIDSKVGTKFLTDFIHNLEKENFNYPTEENITWDGFEKFFDNDSLNKLLIIKKMISKISDKDSQDILMIALSSITVSASKMIRHGDLRYATENEKQNKIDIKKAYINKLRDIINDIDNNKHIQKNCILLSEDARNINVENKIDCVITSPPYLNGTNYIRNTKLELKLNDFVNSEKELPEMHSKGIIAGINNVSKRNCEFEPLNIVKPYVEKLKPVVYDSRITKMVIGYFNDMDKIITKLSIAMKDNGFFIMDIGDSQFAGIHIPTHEILSEICLAHGFQKYDEVILRERKSKNNMILSQRILKFRLCKTSGDIDEFKKKAQNFINEMPYKTLPYSGRNWGHQWHSLCSYRGKLKPAIAHFLIKNFTKPNDVVLDPLCGVGTIPFEACLQGRIGIGNDLSELAYIVTKAKLEKADENIVFRDLDIINKYLEKNKNSLSVDTLIGENSSFGFNGKLIDYFHPETFREIICLRQYFLTKINDITPSEAMIYSAFLHVLHGNRPYALSRISHPLTPYAPKGEFIYKNVIEHISSKIKASYNSNEFDTFVKGKTIFGDYNNINNLENKVDVIICSPPFADSIRFHMQNWMRLWLCGWNKESFKNADNNFLDFKQKKDFSIYDSFFKKCFEVLKPEGTMILHLGKTDKIDMAEKLEKYAEKYFVELYRGSENVLSIEQFGIKDKGATVEHQFLFLKSKKKEI